MSLIASSILVKYSLLNNSGSLVYAGTSSNSLRLWGAQLELAEYSEQILDDFINHFRYTRTTGIEANFISTRLGYGYAPDDVTIGSSIPYKVAGGTEPIPFFINKGIVPNTDITFAGRPTDGRLGNDLEKIAFVGQTTLKDIEYVRTDLRNIPSAPKFDAQAIMGINVARKTAVTFDLNQYQPLSGDNIYYKALDWFSEVPRSQRAKKSVGAETKQVFIDKHFDETKFIPRVKKIDALRVMGLEPINKTSSTVDLARYTPLRSTDITYYNRYDWYSITPRSQYARLAYGIGDGSPYILDAFSFGDHLTYAENKGFAETLTLGYGSTSQTSRLAGSVDAETFNYTLLQTAKRGVGSTIVINNRIFTTSDAVQTQELFYNRPGSPFGKSWYKLAPYYSQFSHILDGPGDNESVHVGQYYPQSRLSGSDQEKLAYVLIKGTFFDSTTMIDNMMINGTDNATFLENKGFFEGVGVGTPASILAPFSRSVYTADQTQELFYNKPGNPYGRNWYQLAPVPGDYLSRYGRRTSGNPLENISFKYLLTAHRSSTANTVRIPVTAPTPTQKAGQLNETFYNQPNNKFGRSWYQLASYYNQNVWLIDTPTDPFDIVRIGGTSPVKTSNPYETIAFLFLPPIRYETSTAADVKTNFVNLALAETRGIPTIPKYDAAHVSELFWNTAAYIDGKKYTPLDDNYTYYKKTEWYNLAPRFSRPRFALGPNGGKGPQMLDNFYIGDNITYSNNLSLKDYFITGYNSPVTTTSQAVYAAPYVGGWGDFMNYYSVWTDNQFIDASANTIFNIYRIFNAPTTTSYVLQAQADNFLNVYVDNIQYINITPTTPGNGFGSSLSTVSGATISLTAGQHVLRFEARNDWPAGSWPNNPGAYAARIIKSSAASNTLNASEILWDTRTYAASQGSTLFPNNLSFGRFNDANETQYFFVNKTAKRGVYREITIDNKPFTSSDAATIMDAFVNQTNRTWFQLTPYYADGRFSRITDGEAGADNVRVGGYWSGIRVSSTDQEKLALTLIQSPRSDSSSAAEYLTKFDNRIARAGAAVNQTVVRTNRLTYSETLTNTAWTTTGAAVLSSLTTLAPSLAYRSVIYDADQLADVFAGTKNNYYGRRWYLITPLATRSAFSSSGISVIIPSSSNTQHGISTTITNTDGTDNWLSLGMYVNTSGGITRVRLDAGVIGGVPHYADFNLSSQTVITSVNVNFAAVVPQGNNWYLVKILAPVSGNITSSYGVQRLTDSVGITDTYAMNSTIFNLGNTDLQVLFGSGDLTQQDGTEDLLT